MRNHPNTFIVPTYDMDIMWHTHLAFPQHYAADSKRFVGKLVEHDDSVDDRAEGSKLIVNTAHTRKLWFNAYGCQWGKTGAMYHGEPPEWYWSDRKRAASEQVTIQQLCYDARRLSVLHLWAIELVPD